MVTEYLFALTIERAEWFIEKEEIVVFFKDTGQVESFEFSPADYKGGLFFSSKKIW